MKKDEAIAILAYHSGLRVERPDASSCEGFLASLRPYRGVLPEAAYHEIMAAIRCLAPDFQQQTLDREVIASVWRICDLGRGWGVYPEGMLRRNGLITNDDTELLATWIEIISCTVFWLLSSVPGQESIVHAFRTYDHPNESRPFIPAI